MAAPPMKSQPLHNFSLSHLKWAHKKSSSSAVGSTSQHHRFRRRDTPDQRRHHRPDPESDHETQPENPSQRPPTDSPQNDSVLAAVEEEVEENGEAKSWNLRPRKEVIKAASTPKQETGAEKTDKKIDSNCNVIKSQRLRDMVEGGQLNGGAERTGKRKVWISLSKEEIEEDVYALTGGRPARRPKKWPRNIQKQLDNVFPGLYLVGVAADSYRGMMLWVDLMSIWRLERKFVCRKWCLG